MKFINKSIDLPDVHGEVSPTKVCIDEESGVFAEVIKGIHPGAGYEMALHINEQIISITIIENKEFHPTKKVTITDWNIYQIGKEINESKFKRVASVKLSREQILGMKELILQLLFAFGRNGNGTPKEWQDHPLKWVTITRSVTILGEKHYQPNFEQLIEQYGEDKNECIESEASI
jgi:hypothetical protein